MNEHERLARLKEFSAMMKGVMAKGMPISNGTKLRIIAEYFDQPPENRLMLNEALGDNESLQRDLLNIADILGDVDPNGDGVTDGEKLRLIAKYFKNATTNPDAKMNAFLDEAGTDFIVDALRRMANDLDEDDAPASSQVPDAYQDYEVRW